MGCYKGYYNIKLALVYTFTYYVSTSITVQQVFTAYIYLLTGGSSSKVGYITGIAGLAQVVTAPFAGCLADKYRRDRILSFGGVLGLISAAISAWGIWQGQYLLLCLSQVLAGIYAAFQNPAMEALYADSTPPGQRSKFNTHKYILLQLAYAGGPLVACIMFWQLGDDWSTEDCVMVMMVGLVMSIIPSILCFLFNDDKAIASPKYAGRLKEALVVRPPPARFSSIEDESCRSFVIRNYVPIIVVVTDVMFGLASGMSVKFFPLYFQTELGMGPVAVSLIYTLSPVGTSFCSFVAQKASKRLGRVLATISFKLSGVALLFLMVYLHTAHRSAAVIVPIFIVRTAVMNCTKPLTRSIIMDCVPKGSRAKWNSLESLTMATWAGSAVLGGILVDKTGLNFNNFITACLQLVSTLPLFLILRRVPCESGASTNDSDKPPSDSSSITGDSSDVSSLMVDLEEGVYFLLSPNGSVVMDETDKDRTPQGIERLLKGSYA